MEIEQTKKLLRILLKGEPRRARVNEGSMVTIEKAAFDVFKETILGIRPSFCYALVNG